MALLISIIIPVYNVEKTLESSLSSIKCSRPGDVEIVFVNDGSSDNTCQLLESFKEQTLFPCQIVHQGNAGVAAARNVGLDIASGKYLAFLDADDWLENGALDRLLSMTNTDADIIGWDFTSIVKEGKRVISQAAYTTPEDALKNLMGGTMKWNLWLFAVKRSLVMDNGIRFLDGADMGEDMAFMLKCFACAGSVRQIHEALYEYNASNPASISQQMSPQRRGEVTRNLESAQAFFDGNTYEGLFRQFLPHLKLYIKLPLLISLSQEDYQIWYDWFPEANACAMSNPALPFRTRLLQWLAAKKFWALVKSYNLLYRSVIRML